MHNGILISGFYGFGNLGDEAVLAGIVRALRSRLGDVPLTVLSADPQATQSAHGVSAAPRWDPRAVLGAMRRAKLFISGGGSLVQDVTSAASPLYYLGLMALASALVPRTMVYAQGVGPLRRIWVRRLTRWAFTRPDVVTVRDPESVTFLQSLGVRRAIELTADPAFLLDAGASLSASRPARDGALIGVAVRPWSDDRFVEPLAKALREFAASRRAKIVVIPFYPAVDLQISRWLAAACGGVVEPPSSRPEDVLQLIGRTDIMVGLRLHALILAAAAGVPPVGVAYDPKVIALLSDLGLPRPPEVGADVGGLLSALEWAWDNRVQLRARLMEGVARLRARAEAAADQAARLYRA